MRREYKTGSRWAFWRWKDIFWKGELYLRRLIIIQTPLFSIMLHKFFSPDAQRHMHDHPVSALYFILKGAYMEVSEKDIIKMTEERITEVTSIHTLKERKWLNWIPATRRHRIIELRRNEPVYTLGLTGPREREWGFHTEEGWVPWKKYQKMYGGDTS